MGNGVSAGGSARGGTVVDVDVDVDVDVAPFVVPVAAVAGGDVACNEGLLAQEVRRSARPKQHASAAGPRLRRSRPSTAQG